MNMLRLILLKLWYYIKSLRFFPHILVFYTHQSRSLLEYERDVWLSEYRLPKHGLRGLLLLLNSLPEYRSLFYFRTGAKWLSMFAKGQNNLEFYTSSDKIGRGLMIWHGFSTVINVRQMGEDCQVWQNVTIGKKTSSSYDDRPILGNGVKICAGAIVVGEIEVANRVTVGAGAILVKDIFTPETVVVAQPSRVFPS